MINIYDIIQTLVPDYKISTNKTINNHKFKKIDTIKCTNFISNQTFSSFFSCLLYSKIDKNIILNSLDNDKIDDEILEQEIEKLKIYMEKYEFNELINVRKMMNMISKNMINNELILFLSGYFGLNIYLYSYDSKLLKIYYLEDKLYIEKESVIITMKKDRFSPEIGYQTLIDKQYYKYSDEFIQDLISDIYVISIGLQENKKLELSNISLDSNFIKGEVKQENNIEENDLTDDIFRNQHELEDDTDNIFNNFKINIKKLLKMYDKNRMMIEINKYY